MTPYAEALEQQIALLRRLPADLAYLAVDTTDRGKVVTGVLGRLRPEDRAEAVMDALRLGQTYYWAPAMCDLVAAAATPAFPDPGWERATFPASAGFAWFARPLILPVFDPMDDAAERSAWPLAAFAWNWMQIIIDPSHRLGPSGHLLPQGFAPPADLETEDWWIFAFFISYRGTPRMRLAVSVSTGERVSDYEASSDSPGVRWLVTALRYAGVALALLRQELPAVTTHHVDRAARHRLERAGWTHEPLIRVVELRRRATAAPDDDHDAAPVAWSCRWVVRGHWRQQACGSDHAERRPTWVSAYLKGPEDKPLKPPRATVFGVVR